MTKPLTDDELNRLDSAMRGWARDLCLTSERPTDVVLAILAAREAEARSIIASLQARLDAVSDLADHLTGNEVAPLIREALNGYVSTAALREAAAPPCRGGAMSETTEVHADLCHKGNYENIIGQPDMIHTRTPGAIPDLIWFTCATEANGINMFPCTGSKHLDHKTVVVCTCRCHQTRVVPPGSTEAAVPQEGGPDPRLLNDLCGCPDVCRGTATIGEDCGQMRRERRRRRAREGDR